MAIVLSPGIMSGAFFIQRNKKNGKEMTGILYFKPDAQMVKLRKKSRKKNRELSMRCIRISLRFILRSRCRADESIFALRSSETRIVVNVSANRKLQFGLDKNVIDRPHRFGYNKIIIWFRRLF